MPALVLAATALSSGTVAAVIGLGATVALVGHLAGSRRTVVTGIAILVAGSLLMIAAGHRAYRDDPRDPRPCAEADTC